MFQVNLNPLYEGPELLSCLKKAEVKALIMDEELGNHRFYNVLKSVVPEVTEFDCSTHIISRSAPMLHTVVIISEKSYKYK